MKRVFIVLAFILSLSCITVYANTVSDDTIKAAVGCDDANLAKIKAIITVMKSDGYSDAAIAGALGNAWQESHWNPTSEGLWGLNDSVSAWNSSKEKAECNDEKVGGWCSTGVHTTAFAMRRLSESMATYHKNFGLYNDFVKANKSTLDSYKFSSKVSYTDLSYPASLTDVSTLNEFMALKDPMTSACAWMLIMERPGGIQMFCMGGRGSISTINSPYGSSGNYTYGDLFFHEFGTDTSKKEGRPAKGVLVYNWLTGSDFKPSTDNSSSTGVDKQTQEDLAIALGQSGYWSESQISSYCRLNELNLEKILSEVNRDNLSGDQLQSLSIWKTMASDDAKQGGFIFWFRAASMLVGILLCVWSVLLYIGFWFDRTNNFIDISLLKVLTFGKLAVSESDDSCTFNQDTTSKLKTIDHRTCILLSILGLVLGVSVLTGTIYKLCSFIINKALALVGR